MVVELTESALVENTAANLDKLQAIKAVGVRLALDDFGTGFSSLGYLRQFPFDSIKIDRSFVSGVDVDEGAAALASSVIRMGKALNLTSLAEGVETVGQADWLKRGWLRRRPGLSFRAGRCLLTSCSRCWSKGSPCGRSIDTTSCSSAG